MKLFDFLKRLFKSKANITYDKEGNHYINGRHITSKAGVRWDIVYLAKSGTIQKTLDKMKILEKE